VRSERGAWDGPRGLGDELVALEVHDQLVLLAARVRLAVAAAERPGAVEVAVGCCARRHGPITWVLSRKESMP